MTLDLEERNSVQDKGETPPPNSDTCEIRLLDSIILPNCKETTTNSIKLRFDESSRTSLTGLELELIQTQMAQKPMLRAEVGMRVRCANKASAE